MMDLFTICIDVYKYIYTYMYVVMFAVKFVIICACSLIHQIYNTPQQSNKSKPSSATLNCHSKKNLHLLAMAWLIPDHFGSIPMGLIPIPFYFSCQVTSRPIHSPEQRKLKDGPWGNRYMDVYGIHSRKLTWIPKMMVWKR